VLVSLSDEACGVIPAGLSCAKYSLTLHRTEGRWCEDLRLVGTDTQLGGRCNAPLEDSVLSLSGARFSFDERGRVFFDHHPVGQLELVPAPNEWQQRLDSGERVLVSLSEEACGVIPAGLICNARYSLTLHRTEGRWCEDLRLVGTDAQLGGRCNARLEDAFISLLGALFSFNDHGNIFFHNRQVGKFERASSSD
jgi:hypothetical protein